MNFHVNTLTMDALLTRYHPAGGVVSPQPTSFGFLSVDFDAGIRDVSRMRSVVSSTYRCSSIGARMTSINKPQLHISPRWNDTRDQGHPPVLIRCYQPSHCFRLDVCNGTRKRERICWMQRRTGCSIAVQLWASPIRSLGGVLYSLDVRTARQVAMVRQ